MRLTRRVIFINGAVVYSVLQFNMGDCPPILLYSGDVLSRGCIAIYIRGFWRDARISRDNVDWIRPGLGARQRMDEVEFYSSL